MYATLQGSCNSAWMVSLQMLGMLEWKDQPGTGSRTSPPSTSPHLPHLIALCTENIGLAPQRQHAHGHEKVKVDHAMWQCL